MATKVEYLMTHIEGRLQDIANDMYELQQENARLTAELAAARELLKESGNWPMEHHLYCPMEDECHYSYGHCTCGRDDHDTRRVAFLERNEWPQ